MDTLLFGISGLPLGNGSSKFKIEDKELNNVTGGAGVSRNGYESFYCPLVEISLLPVASGAILAACIIGLIIHI